MTVKSIVDLELNGAEKLERFQKLFEKYEQALAKTPTAWKAVNKESAQAAKQFERMAAALMAQGQISRETAAAQTAQARTLDRSEKMWSSIAKSTKSVASSILGATRSLLSWTGILGAVGGLLGAGGLWGLDRLSANVSNQRRSSQGLGLSIGQRRAFQVNFERLVDPDAYLSWINQMETDPTKRWSASALGVGLSGRTGDDALKMLDALRARAKATPVNQLGLLTGQFGLQGTSEEDLRRLRDMSPEEYGKLKSGYGRDANTFGIDSDTARKWQDFTTRMERAGATIFKVFVNGLTPLIGPLEHLSQGFTHFLEIILRKNGIAEKGIETLAGWLESFSGKISSPKFIASVEGFTSDVGALANAVHVLANPSTWWSTLVGKGPAQDTESYKKYLAYLDQYDQLPANTLESVWQTESGGSLNPKNSAKGAVGAFQFMPDTAKQYGFDPTDPAASAEGAGKYLHDLNKTRNIDQALAAYNMGPGKFDEVMKRHPTDWQHYIPAETQGYVNKNLSAMGMGQLNLNVTVTAPPGHSATVSVSQLAH